MSSESRRLRRSTNGVGLEGNNDPNLPPQLIHQLANPGGVGVCETDPRREKEADVTTIAIDPGTEQSGFVRLIHGSIVEAGTYPNDQILAMIRPDQRIIIEWLQCYGAAIGQSVLRTAQFCGEVKQACKHANCEYHEMTRPEVCRALVGRTQKTAKAVVRRAVVDCYPSIGGGAEPAIGTKKEPGPLFKMRGSGHAWDALALFEAWKRVQL